MRTFESCGSARSGMKLKPKRASKRAFDTPDLEDAKVLLDEL